MASSLLRRGTPPYAKNGTGKGLFFILAFVYARAKESTPHIGLLLFGPLLLLCFSIGQIGEQLHCTGATPSLLIAARGPFSTTPINLGQCPQTIFHTSAGTLPSMVVLWFFCFLNTGHRSSVFTSSSGVSGGKVSGRQCGTPVGILSASNVSCI